MESIACRDMGIPCNFVARGRRTEQVKKLLFDHALRRHKDIVQKRSRTEIVERMDSLLS